MITALCVLLFPLCLCNVILLLERVFGYRRKEKQTLFYILAALCVPAGAAVGFCEPETAESLTELLLLAISAGIPYAAFERKKKLTFLWVGLMLCSMYDFLEYAAASVFAPITWLKTLIAYNAVLAVFCAVIAVTGIIVKPRRVPDFPESVPVFVFVVIIALDYSAYYSLTVVNSSESYAGAAVVFNYLSTILSACNIGFIVYRFALLSHRKKEDEHIHALELMRYEEMTENARNMSEFRHDYKNNLHALESFISSGRTEEAGEYIASLTDSLEKTKSRFQTGNFLADAILSDKAAGAEDAGVNIVFDGAFPADGIENRDLCEILSNALDNAVEASRVCAPCEISVTSAVKEKGLMLTVSNPTDKPVIIKNNTVKTSKSDKRNHGFGISNIRRTAKKYNGYADISCVDRLFTIEIGLILTAAPKESEN